MATYNYKINQSMCLFILSSFHKMVNPRFYKQGEHHPYFFYMN